MAASDQTRAIPIDPELPSPVPHGWGRYLRRHPVVLAAVAAGGALGAAARYAIAGLLPVLPGAFPWATFWTNTVGSFLLGLLLIVMIERLGPTTTLRPFVATGLLGAFTTYATFAVETDLLVRAGRPALAAVYAVGSVVAGLAAVWSGIVMGRTLMHAGRGRTRR